MHDRNVGMSKEIRSKEREIDTYDASSPASLFILIFFISNRLFNIKCLCRYEVIAYGLEHLKLRLVKELEDSDATYEQDRKILGVNVALDQVRGLKQNAHDFCSFSIYTHI